MSDNSNESGAGVEGGDTAGGGGDGEPGTGDAEAAQARGAIGLVLGVWAIIGLGMGLAPVAIGVVSPNATVGTWSTSLGLLTSAGPFVGGLLGLSLALAVPVEPVRGAIVSLGANAVGFALFVLVFVAILMLAAGSSVAVPVEQLLAATLVAAVPVAITAGGVTGIGLAVLQPSNGFADRR